VGTPVLRLPEEVTPEALPRLGADADSLLGAEGVRLVIDLGDVRFLGSAGLGELVKLGKRLSDRGGAIAIARPRPAIRRLLGHVGLDGVLRPFPTVEEAQAHLERSARPSDAVGSPPPLD
jgi:anti-sigma B factor antagonist